MKTKKWMILVLLCLTSFASVAADSKGSKRGGKGWRESYGGDSAIAEFKFKASEIFNFSKFDIVYKDNFHKIKDIIINSEVGCNSEYVEDDFRKNFYIVSYREPFMITIDCSRWNSEFSVGQKDEIAVEVIVNILRNGSYDKDEVRFILAKYYSYKKRLVGVSEKDNLKTLNFKLFLAVMDCATERYYKLINDGADIFDGADSIDLNLLNLSLSSGCKEITLDLFKNYLPFEYNKKNLTLFMRIALDYNQGLYTFEERKIILRTIIDRKPEFVNASIPKDLGLYNNIPGIDIFYVGYGCDIGSTPLHFWSSGSFYQSMSKDFLTNKYKVLDERNYHLENIKFFKELGFKDNIKNICGKTPRDLLKKSEM